MKTILLTGATGFLGSHLLKSLLNNSYSVIVLKRSFSDIQRITDCLGSESVKFYNTDETSLNKVFDENQTDAVIHCATEYGRNNVSCHKILESNLMFPIELLELSSKYGIKVFLNTDSYFNKKDFSYPYLLNYSLSKKSLELWLEKFSQNMRVANLRLEHIYGENDRSEKFVETMIQQIAIQQVENVDLSKGTQKRDFIYVEDVCKIYLNVLKYLLDKDNQYKYRTVEVGTGKAVTIKEFVETIKKISNSKTKLSFGALPQRESEIEISYADEKQFRLENPTDIVSGLTKIIKEYKGRKNEDR